MNAKTQIGKIGEDLAYENLKNRGYLIIERNHRQKWGELDIIAKAPDKTLVFIEVKTMRQYKNPAIAGLTPEENLTSAKLKKLKRTAQLFVGKHQKLINDKKGWRIDLITINLLENGEHQMNYYENI